MRNLLLAVVILLLSPTDVLAEAAVAHGTTADGSDAFLTAANNATAADAIKSAMRRCRQTASNCRIEAQFHSQCFALAYGHRGGWAYGTDAAQSTANQAALQKCSESGEVCDIVKAFCDAAGSKQAAAPSADTLAHCTNGDDDACMLALDTPGLADLDREFITQQRVTIAHNRETRQQTLADLAKQKEDIETSKTDLKMQMARLADAQKLSAETQDKELLASFQRNLVACKSFDLVACDHALGFAKITDADRNAIAGLRNQRIALLENRKQCDSGSSAACGLALASPALLATEAAAIQKMYEHASLYARMAAWMSSVQAAALDGTAAIVQVFGALPISTVIVSGIALALGLATSALAFLHFRSLRLSGQATSSDPRRTDDMSFGADDADHADAPPDLQPDTARGAQAKSKARSSPPSPQLRTQEASTDSNARTQMVGGKDLALIKPPPSLPRDPITAMQAMRLAASYIGDSENLIADLSDPEKLAGHRSTLALATKQLDIAMRADPSTSLEQNGDDGSTSVVTQANLRATLLAQEAVSYMIDKPHKATALLQRATQIDPEFGGAYRLLGGHLFDLRDKAGAIAAYERALLLDPDDMDTIKALDRARNMSGFERVTFKASRAAEGTMAAGIKTYNGFVFVANIFIYAWNVFAVTWNILMFPFRIMLRLFGLVDRVWK